MSGRVGLVVPSSNIVSEEDFRRSLPSAYTLHTARMHLSETTSERECTMLKSHAPQAAEDLGTLQPDVVVFSCTSAGAILGDQGERELEGRLGTLAGAPVVSTNAAVAECLRRLGAQRVAVATAYVEELSCAIADTLRARKFDVPHVAGMGITDNFAISQVKPGDIVDFVAREVPPEGADALFVSCTNLRSFESARLIRKRIGIPVVTSNMAAVAVMLERLGVSGVETSLA